MAGWFARTAVAFMVLAAAVTARSAAAPPGCTQETLAVRGVPLTLVYCVTGAPHFEGDEIVVPIAASYAAPGGSFGRVRELRFVDGEGASRILENVQLARLGMPGVLHLTLLYAGGEVHVEGALLSPEGITVK